MSEKTAEENICDEKELISDNILIKSFCESILNDDIEFITEIKPFDIFDKDVTELNDDDLFISIGKEKIVKILKGLVIPEKNLDEKARILKKQKIVFQKLWPHFVRNAIKLLRDYDTRDKGSLKLDFGVKNLTKYFKEFSKFEELLYGIDDFYRDHSLHVFRVYLLGDFLIREKLGGYENIDIINKPQNLGKIDEAEKKAMWCIIALCHDLGYPLEKLDSLNKKLLKILEYFGTSNFTPLRYNLPFEGAILDRFILKIISSKITKGLYTHLQSKFYTKYLNAYEKLTHGIMSCILLMKNLVFFKETDYQLFFKKGTATRDDPKQRILIYSEDARQYIIRREILRSIASHDNEDIYHIQMNNFPFLLTICDEIQEWDRPASIRRLYYIVDDKNKEEIEIISFTKNKIIISITINLFDEDFEDYSKKKFKRFIRLLRSAVDSEKRAFDFEFSIKNRKEWIFNFIYKNPLEFCSKNGNEDKNYNEPSCEYSKEGDKQSFSIDNLIKF
jgi:hypothetical protein